MSDGLHQNPHNSDNLNAITHKLSQLRKSIYHDTFNHVVLDKNFCLISRLNSHKFIFANNQLHVILEGNGELICFLQSSYMTVCRICARLVGIIGHCYHAHAKI